MGTISANKIKFVRSLAQKKFRDEHSLFVAEGEKIVAEAEESGYMIEEIFRIEEIGTEAMARISNLSTPSPVLAVIKKPEFSAEDIISGLKRESKGLYLALDGVKDPGNLGTIIRIADWFGVEAIFASPGTVEVFNPKVVQATMGAIFRKKVIYTDLAELCNRFKSWVAAPEFNLNDGADAHVQIICQCPLGKVPPCSRSTEGSSKKINWILHFNSPHNV